MKDKVNHATLFADDAALQDVIKAITNTHISITQLSDRYNITVSLAKQIMKRQVAAGTHVPVIENSKLKVYRSLSKK